MALGERSVTEQRYEAVIQALRHQVPVTEVAARFGVSRQSVHTWIRRYQADGLAGLADRSHQPKECPLTKFPPTSRQPCASYARPIPCGVRNGCSTSWNAVG